MDICKIMSRAIVNVFLKPQKIVFSRLLVSVEREYQLVKKYQLKNYLKYHTLITYKK